MEDRCENQILGGDTRCERYDIRGFSGLREAASGLALVFSEAVRVPQP